MFSFPSCEIGFSDSQAQADCGDICFAGEVSSFFKIKDIFKLVFFVKGFGTFDGTVFKVFF